MAEKLDRAKFAKIIAMVDSTQDGEAVNSMRLASAMLKAADLTLSQVINTDAAELNNKARIANEAAEILAAQLTEAHAEIDRLRAENSAATAVAVWNDVGAKITNSRTTAAWVLDLHRQGLCWLGDRELVFLTDTIPRWVGTLRPRQAAWLQSIADRVVERTGLVPPP